MVIKLQNTKRKKEYILKVTRKKENKQTIIIAKEKVAIMTTVKESGKCKLKWDTIYTHYTGKIKVWQFQVKNRM